MPLDEYRKKRNFDETPEPAGGKMPRSVRSPIFVVQKHDASRLHYDFRLEVDGVLASWAVPKGPSMKSSDRRLAIRTEDHPIEYADFKGVIPAGHYGAGTVVIWDKGTYEVDGDGSAAGQLSNGELKFTLAGQKLKGGFVLIRTDGKRWFLIKRRDEYATADHYGTKIAHTERREVRMPEENTIERAQEDASEGKAPSTQAGEFVREEIEHVREGKHGARSTKQAIAIGLSKARRAGVKLPPPKEGKASERTRTQAKRDYAKGQKSPGRAPSPTRSRATRTALKREGGAAASHTALSRQAHSSARSRGAASRSQAARKAVRTKGTAGLKSAARKAARTRAARNE